MNITQTDFLAVNLVFAISTTIDMAFHPDFLTCILDKSVMIIQSHNYRSIIERFATFGSSKDDIRHLAPTETLDTRLPQSPTQTFCNIGLSRSIGSNNCRHTLVKNDLGLISKRLEPLNFDFL
ncbi:Uncharacterised protein [Streptococcus pneumoniae]|nr:Uncharacterised protein [Streptococcus pneumoniae]